MSIKPFKQVQVHRPGRSLFNLSFEKKMTADMGIIYPVACEEMVPGDSFVLSAEAVVRMNPMIKPIMHQINMDVFSFFVPYRLLWPNPGGWEDFITGGADGSLAPAIPRWDGFEHNEVGSLWDYLGFPPDVTPTGALPLDFPRRAYNMIWNQYFRDEQLQSELDITDTANAHLLRASWEKDYFTSALPWQQRSLVAPSLPLVGFAPVQYLDNTTDGSVAGTDSNHVSGLLTIQDHAAFKNQFRADLSAIGTFDYADLRSLAQLSKNLERSARVGARYTEHLRGHWGVSPKDERLNRAEFIGAFSAPIIISEVLQTSATDAGVSPQGNMAGHGVSATRNFIGKCYAEEFGLMMTLMVVRPKPAYQQGINRQWLRRNRWDFPTPEFVNLSEQAIEQAEIYATAIEADNLDIFGYQGKYDEMRYKPNVVAGLMRTTMASWHLGRIFASAPSLNDEFIQCTPDTRIFAVPSQPQMFVSFGNMIKAIRPIPVVGEPGYMDHN